MRVCACAASKLVVLGNGKVISCIVRLCVCVVCVGSRKHSERPPGEGGGGRRAGPKKRANKDRELAAKRLRHPASPAAGQTRSYAETRP